MIKRLFLSLALMAVTLSAFAVPFKLLNNTPFSIPLEIPGVMNPNLSPMSSSGVDLAVGQKIFFLVKGKKGAIKKRIELLEVTEALAGQKLDVGKLIAERRKSLGL